MDFKDLDITAIPEVRPFLKYINTNTCDYTIGGMFMWRKYFRMQYAVENGVCYTRVCDAEGKAAYNLPLSGDIEASVVALAHMLRSNQQEIHFSSIPEAYVPIFEKHFAIKSISAQPKFFDYLYTTEALVNLQGKKYNAQRNLISQFKRAVSSWSVKDIGPEDIPAIRRFFLENCMVEKADLAALEEQEMVLEVLDHYDSYGMTGGILTAGQDIVGFSMGEIANDTFFVHIEKASRTIKGTYQMLAHQMAQRLAAGKTTYINREEDMGDPGLRKAKEAYYPVEMLKKFTIEVC